MEIKEEKYDSTQDTREHINMVSAYLRFLAQHLVHRGYGHDASKLQEPEKAVFDEHTPRLKDLTYGSPEYRDSLKDMGVALDHHYACNRHHTEYFPNGIMGMTLVDLVEMFCDWSAATHRHDKGDINKSIELNKDRFNYSEVLESIFKNTVKEYNIGKVSNEESV